MTRDELKTAADSLRAAAEHAGDDSARERLQEQARKFDTHEAADRGPDHGRLAHHEHVLTDIADDQGGETAEHVGSALDSIRAYRETVDGV